MKSPSAWDFTALAFVVITDQDAKEHLLQLLLTKNNSKAGAVVAVLGDLKANKNVDDV